MPDWLDGLAVLVGSFCIAYAIYVLAGWPWAVLAVGIFLFFGGSRA